MSDSRHRVLYSALLSFSGAGSRDIWLLAHTSQELLILGINGKDAVYKEAFGRVAASDRTKTSRCLVGREIDVGGVSYQEHLTVLLGLRPRLDPVWHHDLLMGDCLVIEKSVGPLRICPVAHTSGQGDRGVFSQDRRYLYQPICPSWVSQVCRSEGFHCPFLRIF